VSPVLVDSNVLLDVLSGDSAWGTWSTRSLQAVVETQSLVINPIIYAEVSVRYSTIEELEAALHEGLFRREPLPYAAGFLAGKAYAAYRRRGGQRRSPMPDFYIGAHAAVGRYTLLTRDAWRYRTYFPDVPLITPDVPPAG
jgi:predicted nucleic acid-binding protein